MLGASVQAGREVADHPQVGLVVGRVRPAVQPRSHLVAGPGDDARGGQRVDQAGERALGVGRGDRVLEQEQPDQRAERPCLRGRDPAGGRRRLVAGQRRVRLGAQQLRDPVVGEVCGEQCVPEPVGELAGQRILIFGELRGKQVTPTLIIGLRSART